jgi:RHS repeat-associated protein
MFFASEVGLFMARLRAYDSDLGRWLSRDPLRKPELSQGPNLYAYVGNNPVNMIDPSGLAAEECCKEAREIVEHFKKELKQNSELYAEPFNKDVWAQLHPGVPYPGSSNKLYPGVLEDLDWVIRAKKNYAYCLKKNACEPPNPCPTSGPVPGGPAPPPNLPPLYNPITGEEHYIIFAQ